MSVLPFRYFLASLMALLSGLGTLSVAQDQSASISTHSFEYWTSDEAIEIVDDNSPRSLLDNLVEPVQMVAPRATTSAATRTALRPTRSVASRRNRTLASVPFMIGDTTAGNCVSFGGVAFTTLGHPTLGCSRLNISESNTPLPTDRVYFSYRHFANASPTDVNFITQDFDLERFTLAGERTFFDGMMSMELRLPIEHRLTSDIETSIVTFDPPRIPGSVTGVNPIIGGRRTELANLSLIFKALMVERENYALSAGLGVTLPTAQDVHYRATIDTINDDGVNQLLNVAQIDSIAANETIYLAPFASWIYKPTKRFFHQGFFQVEVAANPSRVSTNAAGFFTADFNGDGIFDPTDITDGTVEFTTPPLPLVGFGSGIVTQDLHPQVLMRLNLGFGYLLHENQNADWIQKLTGLFEVHYTGTLSRANVTQAGLNTVFNGVPVAPTDPIFSNPVFENFRTISVGNALDQVHIVNLTTGLSANIGNLVVTHGFTAPVTNNLNRGFDFEYNLQVQRPF